jgi:hypothetical protein
MIQNHIMLFLRKTLIAFPFLLVSIIAITPQVGWSAAIETAKYDIDLFPLHPTESGALFFNVTKKGICDSFDVRFSILSIDPVNREIRVTSETVVPFSGGNDPCHSQFQITDSLPNSGEYQLSIIDLDLAGFLPRQYGPVNFTVVPASASIPTLSEWMLILMALLLLLFAIQEMQTNSVPVRNKMRN